MARERPRVRRTLGVAPAFANALVLAPHTPLEWLAGKPFALRVMLGREDMLGTTTIARGGADYRLLPRTFTWART